MKSYNQYTITCFPFQADLISGLLWELDITGVTEEENSLTAYAESISIVSLSAVNALMENIKTNNLIESFTVHESSIDEKNWNEEWEKSLNVIKVSDGIVIKPTFRNYEQKKNELVLEIDPKMSFGTGEHETTKLSLQLLEKYVKAGMSLLDIGSGTGVLAIAAAKLGAKNVLAVDNDPWCSENGLENVQLNNCENIVSVLLGVLEDVEQIGFDLIVANINKNVLKTIDKQIAKKLSKSGIVILSGILTDDENEIEEIYYQHNLYKIECEQMGEWIALTFKRE